MTFVLQIKKNASLRASSLGGGGREGERGESLQRRLTNFHFCVEFFNAKCSLVDIEFGAYVIALRVRRVDNTGGGVSICEGCENFSK